LAGLPRLAAAGLRVAQEVRELHAQRPEFRVQALSWSLQEFLATARALMADGEVRPDWIGSARRPYQEVGALRLWGLFTEPVVSSTGYAGVVTYLVDQQGTTWTLGDVAPGGVERCQFAYVTPIDVGETAVEHRLLCRQGLELEHASAAANRRLGSGRTVAAVEIEGVRWSQAPLAALWDTPLEVQLDRAWAAREARAEHRRAGDDLLFIRGTILGAREHVLEIESGANVLQALSPSGHVELAYRNNLRLLAGAPGLVAAFIGRIAFSRPRTLHLLAMGADELQLPQEWKDRVNLGLETLARGSIPGRVHLNLSARALAEVSELDPVGPLERRLEQVLLGGRAALSPSTWSGYRRDEDTLTRHHLPTGARVLRALREAGQRPERLALAWLAGRVYASAVAARLQRAAWLN
jgi:hypothetical protein